jgi:Lar family restriction alleviation protein
MCDERAAMTWVVVVGAGVWAKCYGDFFSYDAAMEWVRRNQFDVEDVAVHPVQHAKLEAAEQEIARLRASADQTDVTQAREALEAFISEVLQMVKVWPDAAYRRQYRLCQRLIDAYASALSDAQQQEITVLRQNLQEAEDRVRAAEQEIERLSASISQEETAYGLDTLKPCPFCGCEARIVEVEETDNRGGFVVCCTGCEASTKVWFPLKDDVRQILRDEWNQRA